MKKQFIEFFRPDRNKVMVTILYPYLSWVLVFIIYGIAIIVGQEAEATKKLTEVRISNAIIRGLLISAISYPFICSIFAIFRSYKSGGVKKIYADKVTFALIIFGLVIFNPVSLLFINTYYSTHLLLSQYSTMPGVVVTDVALDSPVERRLEPGFRIYNMEVYHNGTLFLNKKIENSEDFYDILNQTKAGDRIRLVGIAGVRSTFYAKKNVTDWGITVRDIEVK